ncbi:L-lactate dehydrogenase [Anaerorhabdus furcosa]|uniref:L-lactate dehydrogenase n=1 Tax=Anaerorhabdus furcosa TaxID=118967 RepID=A0A1T4JUA9_9FIRM|nr:L-lactate dehydrogenase [Anaerorhabdus furcosa]SJZ33733.1 L-lactate dehydrogenase [Anaerorhabdus furcosa]
MNEKRKIVLVGTGSVGMSMAYSFMTTGGLDELVLIDVNKEKAIGEAMDLQHGLPYARHNMVIKAGEYSDCKGAQIVVITAGVTQRPDETRLDLTARDTVILKDVTENVMKSGFDGIIVVASNPVDGMAYVAQKVSGLPSHRVIGTGTLLDTARLRFMMSEYLTVSTSNIHAYIMGEHGDTSFVPWNNAYIGCKPLLELLDEKKRDLSDLHDIYTQVQQAGYEIVKRKHSTYYGIGLSLNRLVQAILNDDNIILTVSAYQNGEYGHEGLYIGVPAVINREGVREIIKIDLNEVDQAKFDKSCETLKEINQNAIDPLLK